MEEKETDQKKELETKKEEKSQVKDNGEENTELKDRLLRLAAEFDNYKKRVSKENEDVKILSKADIIRKIIPTLDEFELAIESAKDMGDKDTLLKGMEMIYLNLFSSLKNEGLKVIDTSGIYDPYKHEILLVRESNEKDGKIIDVVRTGYTFKDILVRPATVIVAGKKKNIEKEQNEEEQK
jgi:molecular chaperone GrpE